jgi:hypothetical protein
MKYKVISPFCFEEHTVTGDTFLAAMENAALYHVPVITAFQLEVAPPHFCHHFCASVDREFPDC